MKKIITLSILSLTIAGVLNATTVKVGNNIKVTAPGSTSVNVSKNGESAVASKVEETTTTVSSTKEGTTTTELNALAKEAIKEIETKKQVLLDNHYTILVQAQTKDSIDIHIRRQEQRGSRSFGYFRYTQSTKLLEEMDSVTGDYKAVK